MKVCCTFECDHVLFDDYTQSTILDSCLIGPVPQRSGLPNRLPSQRAGCVRGSSPLRIWSK